MTVTPKEDGKIKNGHGVRILLTSRVLPTGTTQWSKTPSDDTSFADDYEGCTADNEDETVDGFTSCASQRICNLSMFAPLCQDM